MPERDDDEGLALRFSATGDARALEALYRRHVDATYCFARRFLDTREDAEEAASECWFRAFNALRAGHFRGESRFRTWVFGIARLVCLERLRQPRLPTLSLSDFTDPNRAPQLPVGPPRESPIEGALQTLSDDHRMVLTLCDLEGFTIIETAAILGRTPAATKSLHVRARRALRDALEQENEP
jgi:RNA polymerase sigma-70 factor (ECF subfamily)